MAHTNDSTRTTDRPNTPLGEVIDQIHDRRIADTGQAEFRFCESSQDLLTADSPRPEPEVIWAD
ncbi:MAG: hypothetical protein J0H98_07175 [Solirubrobacterales bacterium]|nr:hypothetical protein [Solirubrobacterales bacterium]